jgi:hypothetical protein
MPIALYKNISQPTGPGTTPYKCRQDILKVLAYFDIFQYPLTQNDIHQFLNAQVDPEILPAILAKLVEEKTIYQLDEFYSLQNDMDLAVKRRTGNEKAAGLLKKAARIGKLLSKFPYVRGIGVSGSLSKNYADEKADIDFFIITKANRLWIARTLMHCFKKLTFLRGHQHFYCMNYYIDESALAIHDKNIFTAIEIKTLLPVDGATTFTAFFDSNQWTDDFFPNCVFRDQQQPDLPGSLIKRFFEWLFNNKTGHWVDNILWKMTAYRWKRKELNGKRNSKGYTMGLITGKHFAWSDPGSFRKKVLTAYEKKLSELDIFDIRWPDMISLSSSK